MVGDLSNLLLVSAAKRVSVSPYSKPLVGVRNGPQICRLKIDKSRHGSNRFHKVCIDSIAEMSESASFNNLSSWFTAFSRFQSCSVAFLSNQVSSFQDFPSRYPHFPAIPLPPMALFSTGVSSCCHRWSCCVARLDLETTRTTSAGWLPRQGPK